jgi:ATP-dependent Lon protease
MRESLPKIPLFPLPNVVLFPGMHLPLQIFEPRYRQMIRDIQKKPGLEEGTFGVQLCKTYNPMTLQGTPFDVGTTVRFEEIDELEDGRFLVMTTGVRRFCVEAYDTDNAYLQGTVRWLEEEDKRRVSPKAKLIQENRMYFHEAIRLARKILREEFCEPDFPEDPEALSYFIAQNLKGSLVLKQELLEMTSTRSRLKRERELLAEIVKTLAVQAQIEEAFHRA